MKKNSNVQEKGAGAKQISESVTWLYVFLIACIMPFFMQNKLFDISASKTNFFITITAICGGLLLVFACFGAARYVLPLSKLDYLMLIFAIIVLISSVSSPYGMKTWTGSSSNMFGSFVILGSVLLYFAISRFFKESGWFWLLLMVAFAVEAILIIGNRFGVDPLGIYNDLAADMQLIQLGTIGNANRVGTYLAIAIALTACFVLRCKQQFFKIILLVTYLVLSMAAWVVNCSSMLLTFACLYLVLFWFAAKDQEQLKRWMVLLVVNILAAKMVGLLLYLRPDTYMDSLPAWVCKSIFTWGILAILVVLYFIGSDPIARTISKVWNKIYKVVTIVVLVLIGAGICFVFVANLLPKAFAWCSPVVITESWGNYRGTNYIRIGQLFDQSSIFRKCFGYGPDSLYYALYDTFGEKGVLSATGAIESAHNEYLEYLITTGVCGLVSYLGVIFACLKKGLKMAKTDNGLCVCVVLLCYSMQAILNNAYALTLPMLFLLVGLLEMECRQEQFCA